MEFSMLSARPKYLFLALALFLTGCASSKVLEVGVQSDVRKLNYDMSSGTVSNDVIAKRITKAMADSTGVNEMPNIRRSSASPRIFLKGQRTKYSCKANVCELEFIYHNGEITKSIGELTSTQTVKAILDIHAVGLRKELSVKISNKVDQTERTNPLAHTYPLWPSEEKVRELIEKLTKFEAPIFHVNKSVNGAVEADVETSIVKANLKRFASIGRVENGEKLWTSMNAIDSSLPDKRVSLTLFPSRRGTAIEYSFNDEFVIENNKEPYKKYAGLDKDFQEKLKEIINR